MEEGIHYALTDDIDGQSETSTETNHASPPEGKDVLVSRTEAAQDILKKRVAELPGKPLQVRPVTIFRLTRSFHETNKELCEPKMVAIGPYHRGKEGLSTMEEHKLFTLRYFLARNKESVAFEVYYQAMRSIEAQACQCYSETVGLTSDEFVMMLLLDGCFILEWFWKAVSYENVDALCDVGWAKNTKLLSDLCLLENQLPFFVIHKLLAIQEQEAGTNLNCKEYCPLLKLFSSVLEGAYYIAKFRPSQRSCGDIKHLLHLYYIGIMPDFQTETETDTQSEQRNSDDVALMVKEEQMNTAESPDQASEQSDEYSMRTEHTHMPHVSDLQDAGIKFKPKKKPRNMSIYHSRMG